MPPQWPWSRKSPASSQVKTFPSGIKLMHEGENDVVDIIFIHGLTGDRERTWTAKNAALPWIKTLLPSKIPHARIFTFGYDAYVANWRGMVSRNRIGNHSMNLITAVATCREEDDTNTRPILFVCHSLGGLVCKDALIASRQRPERHLQNIFLSTRGIAFLGTPHSGAGLAEWASKLAKSISLLKQTNSQIIAVLETESEVLARIQDNFHTMIRSREQHGLPPIWITCFYEELPLKGVGVVVPHHSAVIPGYTAIGIHNHHRDMTKFERDDDPGFLAIVGELRHWIKELTVPIGTSISTAASFQAPLQEDEGGKMVQTKEQLSPPLQPSNSTAQDTAIGQTMHQTFYSNVNRRSVGYFVPRQDVQEELNCWLLSDSSPRPVVLNGIGGSGKTQLAIQCCRMAEESGFLATLWIDASSPMSVEQSYNIIAKTIQKDFADEGDIETTISLVQTNLHSWSQRWLMVFDNYNNPKAFENKSVKEYIPESKNGYILFTSRHTGLEHLGDNQISVSNMTVSESLNLLLRRSPSNPDEKTEGFTIVNLLGYLALALDQAGAYIRARKLPLKDFVSHYEKRKDKMFREVPDGWEYCDRSGQLSVFTTWEMSFSLISGDVQTIPWKNNFLTLAGFFDPKRISERYFHAYCDAKDVEWMNLFRVDGKWDTYEFGDVLAELHKLSLIQLPDQELGERSFTIHPIVCDWLVYRIEKTKRQQMTMELIYALVAFLEHSQAKDLLLEVNQETTLHLDRCLKHERAIFEDNDVAGLKSLPEIESLFARFYRKRGRYPDAGWLLRRALAENERALGPEHPVTLGTLENLAVIVRRQGDYNTAEQLFERALIGREESIQSLTPDMAILQARLSKKGLGSAQVNTLRTTQKLANVYSDQGRYDEAEQLFEQALKGMEENLGPNHLETLSIGQNLANVYRKRGRYKDAELLYQSALKAKEEELGPEHLDTFGTLENLANVYRKQGRYIEAERMFKRSVESKERKLGLEHPDTLRAVQNLANVYSDQEQYSQAERLYQRALQGNEKLLGLEHPDTLRTMENLANLYSKASSDLSKDTELGLHIVFPGPSTSKSCDLNIHPYVLAQQLLERALEVNKRKRGFEHPDTLGTMENLAIVYYRHKEFQRAESLLKQALEWKEKRLGKQHPETLGTVKNLGNVHYKLGRYDEAELEYKRVLDGKETLEQPGILGTIQNLANIYRKQGRPDKLVLLEAGTTETQSEEEEMTSPTNATSAQKNSNFLNDFKVPLPRGRLFLSIFQGRGLRPSRNPYIICQFQGATHISEVPELDDKNEEMNDGSWKDRWLDAGSDREGTDLAMPKTTPMSNRESRSIVLRSRRTEQKAINWIVNPIWDWNISFDVFGDDTDLDLQVYDRSDKDTEFLGLIRCHAELIELIHDDKWYSLGPRGGEEENGNITGKIFLSIRFQKTGKKNYGLEDFEILHAISGAHHAQVYQVRKRDTKCLYAMKVWTKMTIGCASNQSRESHDDWYLRPHMPSLEFMVDTKFSFRTFLEFFIVADYIPGGELFWHLREAGRFTEECTRFYVAEIILALQNLHHHNLIYGVLRPETILLDATGHIVICDFGLSRGYRSLIKDDQTKDLNIIEYLAPEVLLDKSYIAKMVDFWTLGTLTFEMCCGWSPFFADDPQQIQENIIYGEIKFPRNNLSVEARDFIQRLTNCNPNHRLGAIDGAEGLKQHPFFTGTNWDALAKKLTTPPFNPQVDAKTDPLNFEFEDDSLNKRAATLAGPTTLTPLTLGMQANFKGFTFVDEASLDEHSRWYGSDESKKKEKYVS